MKFLKHILFSVYAALIAALLLCGMARCDCDHRRESTAAHSTVNPAEDAGETRRHTECDDSIADDSDLDGPLPDGIRERFCAEVVMCIDCTGSMNSIINTIKVNALNFYPDLKRRCEHKGLQLADMRLKVIGFRDRTDSMPFETSDFFDMPEQEDKFRQFVSRLKADGGGDAPELGYDAIATAIRSHMRNGKHTKQVVLVWTDADSHPLSTSSMGSWAELSNEWEDNGNVRNKRLIIFAPNSSNWSNIERSWSNVVRHDTSSGGGLNDVDYEDIIQTISDTL